jgi:FAD/FMN-containing dehydrogenases
MSGTGEHGVGVGKKEYLYEELGPGTVELMKTIKRAIDPLGLFNPGKVCGITFSWHRPYTLYTSFIQMNRQKRIRLVWESKKICIE